MEPLNRNVALACRRMLLMFVQLYPGVAKPAWCCPAKTLIDAFLCQSQKILQAEVNHKQKAPQQFNDDQELISLIFYLNMFFFPCLANRKQV